MMITATVAGRKTHLHLSWRTQAHVVHPQIPIPRVEFSLYNSTDVFVTVVGLLSPFKNHFLGLDLVDG